MKNTDMPKERIVSRYNIRALDRAFRILNLLKDGELRSLQELSDSIDLSVSTTFRLLATLNYYQFVERDDQTFQYRLGLTCLELANSYYESNYLRRVALPELEALRDDYKETVHLAVLDKMEIVYLEKLSGLYAIGLMSSRVGGRAPGHCTAVGKVLLAYEDPQVISEYFKIHKLQRYTKATIVDLDIFMKHLEEIRRQNYGFDRCEHEDEVCCIAAPIFDMRGCVIAAISVSGPQGRMEPFEQHQALIQRVCLAAETISIRLGYNFRKASR
jgi:IclR family transcriptional regulator, KDG regulon repressor